MKHKIICGHVIPALETLLDECVDMLMTSVPYWGLRDYGEDTATIWGGDKDCEHDFLPSQTKHDNLCYRGDNSIVGNEKNEEIHKRKTIADEIKIPEYTTNYFCSKCNAWHGQLGLEPTPELYIEHLRMVFAEVKRVLKKTGTCWVNIGDSYVSGKSRYNSSPHTLSGKGRDEPTSWNKPDLYKEGYEDTCMCLIPELFLMMMVFDLGFILRNKNVWKKDNPIPSSVKNRFNNVWEPVYFFTKNNKPVYFYNDKSGAMVDKKPTSQIESVDWGWKTCPFCDGTGVVKKNEYSLAKWFDSELKMRFGEPCKRCKTTGRIKANYWHSVDYWFDLDAVREEHKGTGGGAGFGANALQQSRNKEAREHPSGKNLGDFWSINTQPFPEAHFAVFPEKLCEKPILAGCPAEVCKHCGMARVRITEPSEEYSELLGYSWHNHENDREMGGGQQKRGQDLERQRKVKRFCNENKQKYETIGWTDCQCKGEDKYEPGVTLDPFGGSGTVGVVAEKMGRNSILIDIKRDYCEMALKRLKPLVEQTDLTGKQSTIQRIGF